jgi:hypothetical protein
MVRQAASSGLPAFGTEWRSRSGRREFYFYVAGSASVRHGRIDGEPAVAKKERRQPDADS